MPDHEEGCKLKDLLPPGLGAFEDVVDQELRSNGQAGHSRLAWRFIRSSAGDELRKALDVDVFSFLAQAWGKVRELREYTDESRHPKGETSIVHLHAHDFPLEVNPVVVIRLGNLPALNLRFILEVAAHFDAAALSIRDGFITAIAPGDASLTAQLKYGKTPLHKQQECPKVKLPGRIRFDAPGMRIG